MKEIVLIVDDEEDICAVLSISLSDLGYKIFTANNGEEALRIFKKENPPIVIADIRMPGMDGIELLKKIKQEDQNTEVIMITGHGDFDLAIKSLKYEAVDFITKPINDDALEIALRRAHEKISMRQKVRTYTENLEKLVQEIFGLSHTIKTIAGGLEGGTFVLEKGIELDHKEYVNQGWEMIRTSIERIKLLSTGLLDYAKPNVLDFQLSDPNKIVNEVFELLRARAEKEGINFTLDLAKNLNPFYLDPGRIHQCLLNLISNAFDAVIVEDACEKDREVTVKTLNVDGWGVEYQVIDNGHGVEEGAKAKIFNSFVSTKSSTGTGIGLMITKKIVDEHNGIVEFDSKTGVGTKFSLRLPAKMQP